MDSKQSDRVMAFDALFTTNHIQMLKLLLSYMEPSVQGRLAVYIKFLELQHTLQLIREHPSPSRRIQDWNVRKAAWWNCWMK